MSLFTSQSALSFVVSDLGSSGWLKRHHARPPELIFSDDRFIEAMGVALAGKLRTVIASEAALLEGFLESWAANDMIERWLRTCATALIVDDFAANDLLRSFLEKWYQRPSRIDCRKDDVWRSLYAFRQPLFLDFAVDSANDERLQRETSMRLGERGERSRRPTIVMQLSS
jgi:hypothetical protein